MKIELKAITVRDLVEGYEDNDEEGVRRLRRQAGRPPCRTSASSSTRTSSETPSSTPSCRGLPAQRHVLGRAGRRRLRVHRRPAAHDLNLPSSSKGTSPFISTEPLLPQPPEG